MTGVAMELMANAIQVGISLTVMRALALLMGHGRVDELLVHCFDRLADSVLLDEVAPLAWDEGGALLGRAPEEGLNTVLGEA